MNVRLVNYAVKKKIFPPMRGNIPRFIHYSSVIHRKGWKPDERIRPRTEYPHISGPEKSG